MRNPSNAERGLIPPSPWRCARPLSPPGEGGTRGHYGEPKLINPERAMKSARNRETEILTTDYTDERGSGSFQMRNADWGAYSALTSTLRRASEDGPALSCLRRAYGRQAPRRGGIKGRPATLLGPPSTQRRVRPLWRAETHGLRNEN